MPFQPREDAEPIPGYLLKDRLGIGGYGEVWRVSAPGGLTKAIKFVYGRMDDERAARELKALGRIKEVRHPFLLSLERFDVLEGQLIVVTELADMSLMDRYRQCRDEGLPGIGRDELLGYLRDAADALDYMSEKYGLQHLDIKPENLLLVGGRVKVADFGLVKDLQDAHATAIGGVTPLYATPEAFDGKASRQSDQYSLAIVYQEMLTGVLPFPGFTTAQLAVQHMHSSPLLGPLPEADRPTIARALSKKPEERFASCRQMVDRLLGGESKSLRSESARPAQAVACGEAATGAGMDRSTIDLRSTPCGSHLDETSNAGGSAAHEIETEEHDLPELPAATLELPPGAAGVRPTIFIGVGGTAERILRQLRRRLHQRYGDRSAMPCFQMLLLDTDPHTLRSAEQGDPEDALNPDETLFLPLRKPADYRGASDKILGWLSRRWLYNIPRSLRTEGLRPLGRLAYVDHAEQVQDRLRQVLADATSPAAKARSIETAGGKLRSETPRIFLISSISGGAGSGMLLDLGYAARSALREAGFDSDGVCGVMTHSTLNKSAANDLRKANAYATLTELHYYNHCGGGFREGPASILPAAELSEAPFADSYLVNLGENLSEAELEAACGAVSRYLYLDAATGCGAALDHCRETARQRIELEDGVPRLRSFAIHAIGCDKHAVANAQADLLCHRLVGGWHCDEQIHRRPEKPELEIDELIQRLYAAADKALGGSADAQFRALVGQVLPGRAAAAPSPDEQNGGPYAAALERIHSLLGAPAIPNQPSPSGPTRVEAAIQESAKKLAGALSGSIVKSVTALVEDPRGRLPVALLAVNMFQEQLRELRQNADDVFRRSCSDSATLRTKLQRGDVGGHAPRWLSLWGGKGRQGPEERLVEYCRWRLRTIVFQHLSSLLQGVSGTVSALNEQLAQLRPRLEQLARSFASTVSAMEGGVSQPASVLAASRDVKSQSTRLASAEFLLAFDQRFQQEVLAPQGGLLSLAAAGNEEWKKLRTQLQLYARESVLVSLKEVDAARLLVERYPQEEQLAKQLASALEKAGPRLPLSRTAKRSLAVVPQGASGEAVAHAIARGVPSVALTVVDADSDLVFCQEAEYLSLAKAAAALIESRPDYAAAARRVLTRLDVPWSSLPLAKDPQASVEVAAPEPVAQGV